MPDTTRTFIAIAVPESLAPRVARLQASLAAEIPEARWAVTPPYHVTLAFLGDVPHADLVAVCRAAAEAAAPFAPFEVGLEGVGAFPDARRPRVFWSGVTGPGLATLHELQKAVASATTALGYPPDTQAFHPHVTIGRMKPGPRGRSRKPAAPPRDLTAILDRRRDWSAGPFRVAEAVTFGSTFTDDGPAYARLGGAPLGARPA